MTQPTLPQTKPELTKIAPLQIAAGQQILLGFNTGEEFQMPAFDLRFACPCAACVDELTGKKTLKREALQPDIKIKKVEPVGRYGIHIEWSDGHRTGMYHHDRLYQLALPFKLN